jgi:hypothetical protein
MNYDPHEGMGLVTLAAVWTLILITIYILTSFPR